MALLRGTAAAPSMLSPLVARGQSSDQMRRIGVLLNLAGDIRKHGLGSPRFCKQRRRRGGLAYSAFLQQRQVLAAEFH